MNGKLLKRTIRITNPYGFHLRPIQAFVKLAESFDCEVTVHKEKDVSANGKSALSLLGLAAAQGSLLTIEVSGPDDEKALDALTDLLVNWSHTEDS